LIKYIKSVLWRVAKCLSYIEEARCLKVNASQTLFLTKRFDLNTRCECSIVILRHVVIRPLWFRELILRLKQTVPNSLWWFGFSQSYYEFRN